MFGGRAQLGPAGLAYALLQTSGEGGPTYKGRGRGDERMDRKEVEENSPKVKASRINTRYIDT